MYSAYPILASRKGFSIQQQILTATQSLINTFVWQNVHFDAMSQKRQTSRVHFAKKERSTQRNGPSSQTPRIKSAILHGKATPIQSYSGVNLVRFEHEHGKDGPMVVIAEEWPFRTHKSLIDPELPNISEQAGKHFNVICSYKTSSECIEADPKKW